MPAYTALSFLIFPLKCSSGDFEVHPRRLDGAVGLWGGWEPGSLSAGLLGQRDQLFKHQLAGIPRELVHVGGRESLGRDGFQHCKED